MAIEVLSLDEALEDIKKSILEKGRGKDKKKRKPRRAVGRPQSFKNLQRDYEGEYPKDSGKVMYKSILIDEPFEKGRGKDKRKRKRRAVGIASEATAEKFKDDVRLERKQRGVKESREDIHPRGGHMW